MEMFSVLLTFHEENPPVNDEIPYPAHHHHQVPVMRGSDVFHVNPNNNWTNSQVAVIWDAVTQCEILFSFLRVDFRPLVILSELSFGLDKHGQV